MAFMAIIKHNQQLNLDEIDTSNAYEIRNQSGDKCYSTNGQKEALLADTKVSYYRQNPYSDFGKRLIKVIHEP